jgi:hypothetical protein
MKLRYPFISFAFLCLINTFSKAVETFSTFLPQHILENIYVQLPTPSPRKNLRDTIQDIKNFTLINKQCAAVARNPFITNILLHNLAKARNFHILEATRMLATQSAHRWLQDYRAKLEHKLTNDPSIHDIPAWAIFWLTKLEQNPVKKVEENGKITVCRLLTFEECKGISLLGFLNDLTISQEIPGLRFEPPGRSFSYHPSLRKVKITCPQQLRWYDNNNNQKCNFLNLQNVYQKTLNNIRNNWRITTFTQHPPIPPGFKEEEWIPLVRQPLRSKYQLGNLFLSLLISFLSQTPCKWHENSREEIKSFFTYSYSHNAAYSIGVPKNKNNEEINVLAYSPWVHCNENKTYFFIKKPAWDNVIKILDLQISPS